MGQQIVFTKAGSKSLAVNKNFIRLSGKIAARLSYL